MSGLCLETRASNLKSVALTVLELLAFNSHDRPLRTHKHTNKHTSNEHIISAIHFVHLAEIINNNSDKKVNLYMAPKSKELFSATASVEEMRLE